jgi:RNA polymerase sigma-70 factor (ECF subfamily)
MEDSVLISRFKAGDAEAFAMLYDRYKAVMASYVYVFTGSREEADNIVQEVFLAVIRRADSLTPEGNFRAYLLTRARGLALNLKRVKVPESGDCPEVAADAPGPAEIAESMESAERLADALAALPREQREVVALRAHAGMTVTEIAEMLGEPVGTIKSRYRYALEKLRTFLCEEEQ